ncbi:putative hydrolase [compost metagenome]
MIQAIEGLAADFAPDLRHHRDETIEAMEQQAVDALGYAQQSMVSGAGHDAIHLARYCPTAMVFIPCVGGLSHNEAEDVLPEDVRQGTDVLLNAVLARAESTE